MTHLGASSMDLATATTKSPRRPLGNVSNGVGDAFERLPPNGTTVPQTIEPRLTTAAHASRLGLPRIDATNAARYPPADLNKCGSQRLRAACEQWHSITLAAAHRASCCDGPVGGSFASGFFLLEFIVENRCDRERSNHTPSPAAACAGAPTTRVRVLVCLCFAAGPQEPQGR